MAIDSRTQLLLEAGADDKRGVDRLRTEVRQVVSTVAARQSGLSVRAENGPRVETFCGAGARKRPVWFARSRARTKGIDIHGKERASMVDAVLFPFPEYWWLYAAFVGFVRVLLAVDLGVFHRQAHEVSFREAAT